MKTENLYLIDQNGTGQFCYSSVTKVLETGDMFVDYSGYLYNNKGQNLTVDQYKALDCKADADYKLVNENDFLTWYDNIEQSYITEVKEVNEAYYWDMLEVLPPLNWGTHNGLSSFFMSEFTTGTITEQFAKHGGKFYSKMVDYKKPSTWIKKENLANAPYNTNSDKWA